QVQADALLAAVVDGEIDALSADHGGMPPCFLAAEWLDLDDLGPEVGQEHAAAGPRLEPRQLENADAVEAGDHGVARTFTPPAPPPPPPPPAASTATSSPCRPSRGRELPSWSARRWRPWAWARRTRAPARGRGRCP